MATGYIVRRSGFATGKDGKPFHLSPDTAHLISGSLSQEQIDERVRNGALEAYEIPEESAEERPEASTEGSSRRRRPAGE